MIKITINNNTFNGFVKAKVCADYKLIPNYCELTIRYQSDLIFTVNSEYIVYINDTIFQKGFIVDIKLISNYEDGKYYVIKGADKTNYLQHHSCGLYNYLDIYSEVPTPIEVSKILNSFDIKYSLEVEDVKLFILPHTTDSLWSIVEKIAHYTNSNAISNGSFIRFVNNFDNKINGLLLREKNNPRNNIFHIDTYLHFSNKIKNIHTIGANADQKTLTNNFVNNDNKNIFNRDYLFHADLSKYNLNSREKNNFNIVEISIIIRTHSINGVVPLINSIVSVYDQEHDIDKDLLVIGVSFEESRDYLLDCTSEVGLNETGIATKLTLIDPTVINLKSSKGKIGNKYIS